MKNLKTFDLNCSLGKIPFGKDAIQTYLVFQPKTDILKRLLMLVMAITFITGNLKDCLIKKINSIKTPNHGITPNLRHYGTRARVEFSGSCLEQDKVTFNHGKAVKIYIVYEIIKSNSTTDYPILENCLFGAVYFN